MDEQNEIESVEEQIKSEDGQEEPSLSSSLRSVPLQRPTFDIKSENSESIRHKGGADAHGEPCKATNVATISEPSDHQSNSGSEINFQRNRLTRQEYTGLTKKNKTYNYDRVLLQQ
ncbi:PREDICTED: uncharacterized protein LOC107343347 [Acropora digitifera]|uniref:uncharacterized protein LOC107343347 n=1 Tax=Acropora digitifera TaxID=70779 RepID=UPI00077A8079|nr:PREDICTED: uncharacterized protein LOC107343347 [Acropora digitifera]